MDYKYLEKFIIEHNIKANIIETKSKVVTSEDVKREFGLDELKKIVKSIVVVDKNLEKPLLLVLRGDKKIDFKKLEKIMNKKYRLAKPNEVLKITGYEVGGVPPFGLKNKIETWLDESVLEVDEVTSGGGDHKHLMKIKSEELKRFADRVLDFTK